MPISGKYVKSKASGRNNFRGVVILFSRNKLQESYGTLKINSESKDSDYRIGLVINFKHIHATFPTNLGSSRQRITKNNNIKISF